MRQLRSLVLITIDCLRADHVAFLGYSGDTTPFLDSLADQSFIFHNAIASGIPTYYSLPALLASRYPLALGRDVIGLAPGENTLATELQACGFHTAAFIAGNPYVSSACGYENGFDVFQNFLSDKHAPRADAGLQASTIRGRANEMLSTACHSLPALGAAYDELYFRYCQRAGNSPIGVSDEDSLDALRQFPSADVIVDSAISWLNEHAVGPFFLWLHFMDPHAPYYPKRKALDEIGGAGIRVPEAKYLNSFWARGDIGPARLQNKFGSIQKLYDAGIRWADFQIGRFTQKLVELGRWDDCVMSVTADHGEEFLDHVGRFHAPTKLTEELIRVPLLLRVPGFSKRRDFPEPLGLIDLAPTLLDALEMPAPASFHGKSCWGNLTKNEGWHHPLVTECVYRCNNPFDAAQRRAPRLLSVRQGNYKLVVNFASGKDEFFDLNSDPQELRPLPLAAEIDIRKELLRCAKKHIRNSHQSARLDLRLAAQMNELRFKWSQPADRPN